jgi:hypothetical protein
MWWAHVQFDVMDTWLCVSLLRSTTSEFRYLNERTCRTATWLRNRQCKNMLQRLHKWTSLFLTHPFKNDDNMNTFICIRFTFARVRFHNKRWLLGGPSPPISWTGVSLHLRVLLTFELCLLGHTKDVKDNCQFSAASSPRWRTRTVNGVSLKRSQTHWEYKVQVFSARK